MQKQTEFSDIYQMPSLNVRYQSRPNYGISIGDLHGNAMKLMFMLIKHGIVTNMTKESYSSLVELYIKDYDKLTKADLDRFNQILATLHCNKGSILRLIGDELADRGSNDYFTLKIFQMLQRAGVAIEINISNHAIEFVEAFEKHTDFKPPMLQYAHAQSLFNLKHLMDQGFVTKDEILKIAETSYYG